jgi:hypothetical protein
MCNMGHHGHHHGGGMRGHGFYGWGSMGHGGCCGGMHPGCCIGRSWRHFISPAEEMERLQDYLEELKKEVAGVEARINELKGKK